MASGTAADDAKWTGQRREDNNRQEDHERGREQRQSNLGLHHQDH
jgi:hypothetical protein